MSIPEDRNSEVFASLKHPIRRRILRILSIEPRSFSDMQKEFGIESSHLSYHLDSLGNLLYRGKDGKYSLSDLGKTTFSLMREVGETHITPQPRPIALKKNRKMNFRIGKYSVPAWPAALLLMSMISVSVLGYYLYSSFTVSLDVKEPIEILGYPSQWSLYPGERAQFNVTINNHAPVNYSVILDFKSNDAAYQLNYLSFSNQNYTVIPGQQNLGAWLDVSPDAPAANLNMTISLLRVKVTEEYYGYDGLVGYWKLDEGSGNVAADSSGHNNNGVLENGASWVAGKYGFAVGFDGIDDRVNIPDSPSLRLQTFTLEAWIYLTERPYEQAAPHAAIINKLHWRGGSSYNGYKLQFENPTSINDDLVVSIGNGGAQTFLIHYNSINDLTLNMWHQIVGTYDGTTACIYIDGVLKKLSNVGNHAISNDEGPLLLGNEYYASGCQFDGLIDTAMIYNRSLTSGEVLAHYVYPPP